MKYGFLILAIALVSCKTTSPKTESQPVPNKLDSKVFFSPEELHKLDFIETTGRLLWIKDSLAWQATDILVEATDLKQYKNPQGWLVHINNRSTPTVTFYDKVDSGINIIADIVFNEDFQKPKLALEPNREIHERELQMLTALNTVRANITSACSKKVNSVVLPMENGWQVYILTATTDNDVIPVGGHKQYLTSLDGNTILSEEAYSKSCIALEKPKDASNVRAMMMSHIVDDMPAPTHVFHNLQTGLPFYISTKNGLWKIEDGKVSLVKQ